MEENNGKLRGWREKLFNKKVLLIIAAVVVVAGVGAPVFLVKASDYPPFCTTCHIMKPYYDSWNDSSLLANKHAKAELNCHDCHESSITIQAEEGLKFITGDYKVPLDKRNFSKDFCLNCHNDFDVVKAKTGFEESNPHESHIGEQECNTCHSMHQQSKAMCADCHNFTWLDELDDGWAKK